mmetsp:Transcript_62568/g.201774  ORF Transcript_62568/g.201774 Transcript_62568/m.201774 type:complete len:358 (-) Transcript_62568:570-1643(-)
MLLGALRRSVPSVLAVALMPPLGTGRPRLRMSRGSAQVPLKATWKLRLEGGPARLGQEAAFTGLRAAFTKSCSQARQLPHSATHCCRFSSSMRLALMTGVLDWLCQMVKCRVSKARFTSRCWPARRETRSSDCVRSGATKSTLAWGRGFAAELALGWPTLVQVRLMSPSRSVAQRVVLALSRDSGRPPAPRPWDCAAGTSRAPPSPAVAHCRPLSPTSQMPMRCPTWSLRSRKGLWKSCTCTSVPLLSRRCTLRACAGMGSVQESAQSGARAMKWWKRSWSVAAMRSRNQVPSSARARVELPWSRRFASFGARAEIRRSGPSVTTASQSAERSRRTVTCVCDEALISRMYRRVARTT